MTSKNLRFEAMRLYFAIIDLLDDERKLIERFAAFRTDVGPLVKTLVLKGLKRHNHYVHTILTSVPNLKSLTLTWSYGHKNAALGRFLPSKPPFHLEVLDLVDHVGSKALTAFVKTQRVSLVRLHASYIDGHEPNFDIPHLRVLGSAVNTLTSFARSTNHVKCARLVGPWMSNETPELVSIRALCLGRSDFNLAHLRPIFSNLRFLVILNVSCPVHLVTGLD